MASGGHNKGKGRGLAWLKAHVSHTGADCLIWPWSKNHQGYGQLGYFGKVRKAHHIMCLLAHGPAPADKPQASHLCGNGKGGCVHPQHLSWKDNSENQLDRRAHGTQEGAIGRKARLNEVQIKFIQQAKGRVPQLNACCYVRSETRHHRVLAPQDLTYSSQKREASRFPKTSSRVKQVH